MQRSRDPELEFSALEDGSQQKLQLAGKAAGPPVVRISPSKAPITHRPPGQGNPGDSHPQWAVTDLASASGSGLEVNLTYLSWQKYPWHDIACMAI